MPKDALPERLQDSINWKNTDWDTWYQRWMIPLKGLFAYGSRSKHWWACWRLVPLTLFVLHGGGPLRYEAADGSWEDTSPHLYGYLARCQYWCRWHFAIKWPFLITGHCYFHAKDVPQFPIRPGNTTDNKLISFYVGCNYDTDLVYWAPSGFIGLTWK